MEAFKHTAGQPRFAVLSLNAFRNFPGKIQFVALVSAKLAKRAAPKGVN
jgi:hypothetical protein